MNQPPDPNQTVDSHRGPGDTPDTSGAGTFDKPANPLATADHVPEPASNLGSGRAAPVATDAPASVLPAVPGYRVLGEIARGGMGKVLAAVDLALDRDVALKILLPGANADRFVRESKITARLPHPGIPPVHALGTAADGSPFLAMKRIAGQTLADELQTADRPRLLQAFTQICQAVGFAHSRGIIHRDLKPANVMVGAFGEVQVMDWGLAKDLANREHERPELQPSVAPGSPAFTNRTLAGQVMGTPAYLAPEQARGEVVDARADVFGLGAILCTILTGKPPFTGSSTHELLRQASAGDLVDAFTRLEGCGADPELIRLTQQCLAPDREQRPADGEAVAAAITRYQEGVQQRLREAETERARAELRVTEERKRRRLALGLACTLFGLVGAVALGGWSWQRQSEREAARIVQARDNADDLMGRAELQLRQGRWEEAATLIDQAGKLLSSTDLGAERSHRHGDLEAGLSLGRRLDGLRSERLVLLEGNSLDARLPSAYRQAFQDASLDIDREDPAGLAQRVAASPVRAAILAAVDDWAVLETDGPRRDRLLAMARQSDPGAWQERFRDPAVRDDRKALEELAGQASIEVVPAGSVSALGLLMERAGADPIPLLQRFQSRHPDDFWLCFALGSSISKLDPGRQTEAVALFEAARALRPTSVQVKNNLGNALCFAGNPRRGKEILREVVQERPDFVAGWYNLAVVCYNLGEQAEAKAAIERAIDLLDKGSRPPEDLPYVYNWLGMILAQEGDANAAKLAFQKGARLGDRRPLLLVNLAFELLNEGNRQDGATAIQSAIEAADAAISHNPRDAWAWVSRGYAHYLRGMRSLKAEDFGNRSQ
jgi:tetratricopeptide (TPR) repeat protein